MSYLANIDTFVHLFIYFFIYPDGRGKVYVNPQENSLFLKSSSFLISQSESIMWSNFYYRLFLNDKFTLERRII